MTDKEEFILSELKRLQREIDVLKEVYAHYLEEGLNREERTTQELNKMRALVEEAAKATSEQLEENIKHSNGLEDKIEELEEKIEELEEKIEELEEI
jgi:soluble cytochrome b562